MIDRGAWGRWAVRLGVLAAALGGAALIRQSTLSSNSLPSYLPKSTPVGVLLTASPLHPRLGIEGDTMLVVTPAGRTFATVVGPAVPEEGQFPVPSTSPCTFTVTLAAAHGAVALNLGSFFVVDEQSRTHSLSLLTGSKAPPHLIPDSGRISFKLTAVLPTGSGELVWAPEGKPLASWDFEVEID